MPYPMKIQPIDCNLPEELSRPEPKSRLKRLFERQFPTIVKSSGAEKVAGAVVERPPPSLSSDGSGEFEPSSVCLAKMVQHFIEGANGEKPRSGRSRRSCFNGKCSDSSDDDWDLFGGEFGDLKRSSSGAAPDILKSLVLCASVSERNLLADTAKIVEKNKMCRRKGDSCRKIVAHGLRVLGYDALICKSRWEKSSSYPAGEYEYIDVIIKEERLLIDVDFRSEFEIARPTKTYKSIQQTLPYIFVGKADRLQRIIIIASEAAKRSLKKRGMHIPPWRKAEYIKAKWLTPHIRTNEKPSSFESDSGTKKKQFSGRSAEAEIELEESVFDLSDNDEEEVVVAPAVGNWKPPEVKVMNLQIGGKIKPGLALAINRPRVF